MSKEEMWEFDANIHGIEDPDRQWVLMYKCGDRTGYKWSWKPVSLKRSRGTRTIVKIRTYPSEAAALSVGEHLYGKGFVKAVPWEDGKFKGEPYPMKGIR